MTRFCCKLVTFLLSIYTLDCTNMLAWTNRQAYYEIGKLRMPNVLQYRPLGRVGVLVSIRPNHANNKTAQLRVENSAKQLFSPISFCVPCIRLKWEGLLVASIFRLVTAVIYECSE